MCFIFLVGPTSLDVLRYTLCDDLSTYIDANVSYSLAHFKLLPFTFVIARHAFKLFMSISLAPSLSTISTVISLGLSSNLKSHDRAYFPTHWHPTGGYNQRESHRLGERMYLEIQNWIREGK